MGVKVESSIKSGNFLSGKILIAIGGNAAINPEKEEQQKKMSEESTHYEINEFSCIGCSYCKLNCKFNSIKPNHSNIMSIESLTCAKCGLCMNVCPVNAIHLGHK